MTYAVPGLSPPVAPADLRRRASDPTALRSIPASPTIHLRPAAPQHMESHHVAFAPVETSTFAESITLDRPIHHGHTFGALDADKDKASQPRNLVILLDGTGNQFSNKNSNVIKMLSVLAADDDQLVYYSTGVGTVLPDHASTWGRIRTGFAETTDKMLAWNHYEFLTNAYKYLMDFYRDGDRVFIFGFSRGAYTARALAGMIQKVGLLPPGNYSQVRLAYEVYSRPPSTSTHEVPYQASILRRMKAKTGPKMEDAAATESSEGKTGKTKRKRDPAVMYRQIFGISWAVNIEFVGVWDTVSSLGGIFLPHMPNAGNVPSAKFFRHALALDERRVRFAPEYRSTRPGEVGMLPANRLAVIEPLNRAYKAYNVKKAAASAYVDWTSPIPAVRFSGIREQLVERNKEVWFMGCHSDVGGGNDENEQDSLSNIPFRWMLMEAVHCGIKLDAKGVALQPALYRAVPIRQQNLIPEELSTQLELELSGDPLGAFDGHKARLDGLINDYLRAEQLVHIVETAAAYDTLMDDDALPHSIHSRSSAALASQSHIPDSMMLSEEEADERLEVAEQLMKRIREGVGAFSRTGSVKTTRTAATPFGIFSPKGRWETLDGMPMTPDGLRSPKESLSIRWMPLEVTLLQTRQYGAATYKERTEWRLNVGRGREIAKTHTIHRSVLKRLRYDNPVRPLDDEDALSWLHRTRWMLGLRPRGPTLSSSATPTQTLTRSDGTAAIDPCPPQSDETMPMPAAMADCQMRAAPPIEPPLPLETPTCAIPPADEDATVGQSSPAETSGSVTATHESAPPRHTVHK